MSSWLSGLPSELVTDNFDNSMSWSSNELLLPRLDMYISEPTTRIPVAQAELLLPELKFRPTTFAIVDIESLTPCNE